MLNRSIYEIAVTVFMVAASLLYTHPLQHRDSDRIIWFVPFAAAAVFNIAVILCPGKGTLVHVAKFAVQLLTISAAVYAGTESNKRSSMYVGIWSAMTAQFLYVHWAVIAYFCPATIRQWEYNWVLFLLFGAVVYGIVACTLAKSMPDKGHYRIGPIQFSSAVGFLIVFEILYVQIARSELTRRQLPLWIAIILAQYYCVTMLYLQTELFKKSAMEKELLALNLLWQKQKVQYDLNKENIDLINQKCHDLKHQVAALRGMSDAGRQEEYLREVESSIQIYDAIVRTGNEVLDTILTEKSLYCKANGIKINCIVNGGKLSFLDTVDLYTILGNAVDNAIEGVRDFSDSEKKLIDISIYTKNNFLVIHITNPTDKKPQFRDGFPVSTKPANGYHGYGLKSIRHTVQKYEGYMNVAMKDPYFDLKIVIPMP